MPETFHFQAPEWFWLLIPLLSILWLLRRSREQSSAWHKVCDARLLPYLLDSQHSGASTLPAGLLLAGGLLAVIALADPVWEQREQPVYRNEAARVIVLDLSNSMLSPDMKPSRVMQARYKVADILKQDLDGQTGLVAFAGDAFTVAPLTHDTDTIQALLSPLQPSLMPVQGSRVDLGLHKAAELLQQAGLPRGDIVLVTDGIDGERAVVAARQVAAQGYRVSVLAVGTDAGAPIPNGRGGFQRDSLGEIVMPALDQSALRDLAAVGGGEYALISSGEDDIRYLFTSMAADTGERVEQPGLTTDAWHSTGPLLAALLLPLAALAFRRGWLLVMVLLVGGTVSAPQPAMALGWDDLWLRPDQQASRHWRRTRPCGVPRNTAAVITSRRWNRLPASRRSMRITTRVMRWHSCSVTRTRSLPTSARLRNNPTWKMPCTTRPRWSDSCNSNNSRNNRGRANSRISNREMRVRVPTRNSTSRVNSRREVRILTTLNPKMATAASRTRPQLKIPNRLMPSNKTLSRQKTRQARPGTGRSRSRPLKPSGRSSNPLRLRTIHRRTARTVRSRSPRPRHSIRKNNARPNSGCDGSRMIRPACCDASFYISTTSVPHTRRVREHRHGNQVIWLA
jgi:hypothetical protein